MWAYSLQNGEMNEKKEKEAKPYRVVPGHDLVVLLFCATLGIHSISLRATCRSLQEQKTELEAKKSDLEKEAKSIEEQKKYMQTNEYIEEMAREKFGLVYDDEIVFKAK